jgi:uroporphyrinogen-III decarboxylase
VLAEKVSPEDEMTSRERMLAAYRGEPTDRLPYWAKVANNTWRSRQSEPVRAMTGPELLDFIRADGIFGIGHGVRQVAPHVEVSQSETDGIRTEVFRTPDGDLTDRWQFDPYTRTWHPVEFPVKTREDIGRFRWLFRDVRYEVDEEKVAKSRRQHEQIGQRGITKCSWVCPGPLKAYGTTPLMHLVEHVIGPVQVHLMLHDHPDELEELMELMHADDLARVKAVCEATSADLICSMENTSTTLISPDQFERYCLGHLTAVGRVIHEAGKMHELHMCGKTHALLERIDTIPAVSIEAFTSPNLGDTRLVDGRTRAPSKTLVGGTNVNVWLWPEERIHEYILGELAACPDRRHIVLTTAGVAPPACPAEKFRRIGQWLREAA